MILNILDNVYYYILSHNKITIRFNDWTFEHGRIYLFMDYTLIAKYKISEKTFNKQIREAKKYYISNAIYNQDTKKIEKFKNIFGEKEFIKLNRKGKK